MNKKDMILALIQHYSGGNKAQFASLLGISPQGLSTWIKRETFDNELIFSKCVGLSPEWLLTGKGEMLKSAPVTSSSAATSALQPDVTQSPCVVTDPTQGVPYFDVDFIGGFSEIFNDQTATPALRIIAPGFEKATVWCNVTGHSMEPKICHGDIIALRQCRIDDIQYGEIYALVLDTIRTIKILRRGSQPGTLLFVPINKPDFEDQQFPISRIIQVYEVIGSISKFF